MRNEALGFARQFVAKPKKTGACFPSSPALARKMLESAAPSDGAVIVEYGPGTGAFTGLILSSLRPGQRFFAVETNETFINQLHLGFPGLGLHHGCASDIGKFMVLEGVDRVDCVISGLPWAVFPDVLQENILEATVAVMPPGGVFVTFAYAHALFLPAARRFRKRLLAKFSSFTKSGLVLANIPPAYVYKCIR